jgi:hypothetical protein
MRALIFVFFISLTHFSAYSQKQANTWYFGDDGAGLDFNTDCTPKVLSNGRINGFEGCATMSNKSTGQLLFYTNSEWIWNANHDTMANSNLVTNGNTITQVLIIPKPGSSALYYIITAEVQGTGLHGYRFHLIDMTLNAGLGGIVFKDSSLYTGPVTEKITAIKHANGNDIWIVGHQYNSNKFLSFLVSASGINTTPAISSIGKIHTDPSTADAIGELKAAPDGTHIACVTNNTPNIELFNFNNTTGQLSNLIILPELGGYDGLGNSSNLYGLSFSANNKMLYVSQLLSAGTNINGKIIQYNISSNTKSIFSLKLGPDKKIYAAHNVSETFLGVINNPDSSGITCNYNDSAIDLNGKHSSWGLNNLMEYTDNCGEISSHINATEITIHKAKVFPNPAYKNFKIQFEQAKGETYNLFIYNSTGQLKIAKSNYLAEEIERDNLISGLYLFRIYSKGKAVVSGNFILE